MIKLKGNLEYLTHYTNIESLEKILSSQTFKFSAARKLNDKLEGRSIDSDLPLEYTIYSSSWCEDLSDQGIDYMWSNYTKKAEGIRIFAPKHIFKKFSYNTNINKAFKTHLPLEYHECFLPTDNYNSFLYKISYTDELNMVYPSIKSKDAHWDQYNIFALGKYKEKKWEQEKEWRYSLFLLHRGVNAIRNDLRDIAIETSYPECIFIKFKYSIYNKLIIQARETLSDNNRKKLHEMAKKYKFKVIE